MVPVIRAFLQIRVSTNIKKGYSGRKLWKKRWRHVRREILKHAHGPWDVTIAEMDRPEMEDAEAPFRHDLDEPPIAQQLWLHNRRKVADAGACEQRSRQSGVLIYRKVRLERQSLFPLSVLMHKDPSIHGLPKREREQAMVQQVLRCFGRLALCQIV